jgi:hypothetical protein
MLSVAQEKVAQTKLVIRAIQKVTLMPKTWKVSVQVKGILVED